MTTKKPTALIILDGWGIAEPSDTNAISVANTPNWDKLTSKYQHTQIAAHGKAVGLPGEQMGNSEVGHLNLGAGRVVKQDLLRINEAVEDGSMKKNPALVDAIEKSKAAGGKIHLMGLCSPGGVHSSLEHLYAAVDACAEAGAEVYLHAITDGRDTPPSSARGYVKDIEAQIGGKAKVASVTGRFWAMDRDTRWDRVERAYNGFTLAEGHMHRTADEAIGAAYDDKQTDEFIEPRIITDAAGKPLAKVEDGDAVIFFNFRADRAREITQALAFADFDGFTRKVVPQLAAYLTMTEYRADFGLPMLFPPESMSDILGEVLQANGRSQFRCAETEKYAHVTFFFNGGEEEPFKGENRKLIPSPKEVATYDLKPQMSAELVGNAVVERLQSDDDDFVLVNFANPDMVGHTGFVEAAVTAIEAVDEQVGRVCDAVLKKGGSLLITADHGNSEQMQDPVTKEPHTAHTTNPVPVLLVDDARTDVTLVEGGALQDLAPTVLDLMGIEKPAAMTGASLITK